MAITTTSVLADSVKTLYNKNYQLAGLGMEFWDQACDIKQVMNGEKGNVVEWDSFPDLDPVTTALSETSDITPVTFSDTPHTITLYEYANAIQSTKFLRAVAYNDTEAVASEILGRNRATTLDLLARTAAMAGTNVMRINNRATRVTLVAGTDNLTAEFLEDAVARMRFWKMEAFGDGSYQTFVPPGVTAVIRSLGGWQAVSVYNDAEKIFNGEIGKFAGIKFAETYMGKTYFGEGEVAQAATTVATSIVAGATSVDLTDATGIVAGDYIRLGAADSDNTEQVYVSAVATNTVTFSGMGINENNFGCRYAHAAGEAAVEATQVYAIPLMGPKSLAKAYSSLTGPKGLVDKSGPFDIGQRFANMFWYAILGYGLAGQKRMLRLEVATSRKTIGANAF